MTLFDYTTIVTVLFCFIAIPGPDFFMVSNTALQHGRMNGLICSAGVATGYLIFTALAITSVGIVVTASIWAQLLIKLIGGGYLCYVAWQVWQSAAKPLVFNGALTTDQSIVGSFRSYLKGLITDLTNPNCIVFFSSIFLSMSKQGLSLADHISLVVLSTLLALGWFCFVVWSLSLPSSKRIYVRSKTWFDRIGAVIFALFAFRLWYSLANLYQDIRLVRK